MLPTVRVRGTVDVPVAVEIGVTVNGALAAVQRGGFIALYSTNCTGDDDRALRSCWFRLSSHSRSDAEFDSFYVGP
jgi:hypothetical protein